MYPSSQFWRCFFFLFTVWKIMSHLKQANSVELCNSSWWITSSLVVLNCSGHSGQVVTWEISTCISNWWESLNLSLHLSQVCVFSDSSSSMSCFRTHFLAWSFVDAISLKSLKHLSHFKKWDLGPEVVFVDFVCWFLVELARFQNFPVSVFLRK